VSVGDIAVEWGKPGTWDWAKIITFVVAAAGLFYAGLNSRRNARAARLRLLGDLAHRLSDLSMKLEERPESEGVFMSFLNELEFAAHLVRMKDLPYKVFKRHLGCAFLDYVEEHREEMTARGTNSPFVFADAFWLAGVLAKDPEVKPQGAEPSKSADGAAQPSAHKDPALPG
jgi:hypothetical protein